MLDLKAHMEEVADVLRTITGLQVFAHPPEKINPPGGAVSYPDGIDYGVTYGGPGGAVRLDGLNIVIVANRATSKSTRDKVSGWVANTGPNSIPALLDAHEFTTCDVLTVTRVDFDVVTIGAVDYLAAMFKATVLISGG